MDTVFFTNYCSILESEVLGKELSYSISYSTYFINPRYSICIGKAIIIDLPIEINIEKLHRYSDIYSRFPIDGIENVIPFEVPKNVKKVENKDYSLCILTKYLMDSDELEDIETLNSSNFLLGIQTEIDGYLTAVGYKLLNTDLDKFNDSNESN